MLMIVSGPSTPGTTRTVTDDSSFAAAIAAASPGDTIDTGTHVYGEWRLNRAMAGLVRIVGHATVSSILITGRN
jgi:hypothetical protein